MVDYLVFYFSIIGIVCLSYMFIKSRFTYWERRAIPYIPPIFPYGNLKGFAKTRHLCDALQDAYMYCKSKGPCAGMFMFLTPAIVITDLDLVRDILIKDFYNFTDRPMYYNEKDEPLSAHLFALQGQKWKYMRNKIIPTFSSGKMKYMFQTMAKVGQEFQRTLRSTIDTTPILELRDFCARYTTDIIGSCAFGIECNSLVDPLNPFRVAGKTFFENTRHNPFIEVFFHMFPKTARFFGVKLMRDEVHKFYIDLVKETVAFRQKNNIRRNDFMDILIELKKEDKDLTIEQIAAQVFVIFVAGYESTSSTLSFCLYELSKNPEIQEKLRDEILKTLNRYNGKLVYEAKNDMKYLDSVINETLRMYPPGSHIFRVSKSDYLLDGTRYIPAETIVLIPTHAIHYDDEIYKNPKIFDPTRFSSEAVNSRHRMSFLPFSNGPRNCIGSRFAKIVLYVGLVNLLSNFRFSKCTKTQDPIVIDVSTFLYIPRDGIFLQVEKL